MGSHLRDFLQAGCAGGDYLPEATLALMAWVERQQRAMDEMGTDLHNVDGGLRVHEVDYAKDSPPS